MLKDKITIDEAIATLNEAIQADREAMTAMVETRFACNETLADHPTIQVVQARDPRHPDQPFLVGLLGIINGLFGVQDNGWGPIAAKLTADGMLMNFERTAPNLPEKK